MTDRLTITAKLMTVIAAIIKIAVNSTAMLRSGLEGMSSFVTASLIAIIVVKLIMRYAKAINPYSLTNSRMLKKFYS